MLRYVFVTICWFTVQTGLAQQSDSWSTYFETEQLNISTRYSECHYPEKGVHNKYLLLRIDNTSSSEINLSYKLNRSYNGESVNSDVENFEFTIPANGSVEASCQELTKGLCLFASMIEPQSKSKLSGFEISSLSVNGKVVKQ